MHAYVRLTGPGCRCSPGRVPRRRVPVGDGDPSLNAACKHLLPIDGSCRSGNRWMIGGCQWLACTPARNRIRTAAVRHVQRLDLQIYRYINCTQVLTEMAETTEMHGRALLSWSTGKDCSWALSILRRDYPNLQVVGLLSTFNQTTDPARVAMHATRLDVAQAQAAAVGLPLWQVDLPAPCPNLEYARRMSALMTTARDNGITHIAYGDLHLADVRAYREKMHDGTGIKPVFPIWCSAADIPRVAQEMMAGGVRAIVLTVDPKKLIPPERFAGRHWDAALLADLPPGVDHCAEFGEFHTLAIDGPAFEYELPVKVCQRIERDGFVFTEVQLLDQDKDDAATSTASEAFTASAAASGHHHEDGASCDSCRIGGALLQQDAYRAFQAKLARSIGGTAASSSSADTNTTISASTVTAAGSAAGAAVSHPSRTRVPPRPLPLAEVAVHIDAAAVGRILGPAAPAPELPAAPGTTAAGAAAGSSSTGGAGGASAAAQPPADASYDECPLKSPASSTSATSASATLSDALPPIEKQEGYGSGYDTCTMGGHSSDGQGS